MVAGSLSRDERFGNHKMSLPKALVSDIGSVRKRWVKSGGFGRDQENGDTNTNALSVLYINKIRL